MLPSTKLGDTTSKQSSEVTETQVWAKIWRNILLVEIILQIWLRRSETKLNFHMYSWLLEKSWQGYRAEKKQSLCEWLMCDYAGRHLNVFPQRVCVCVCVSLAQLHWSKSLWETFSADCNLFQEHKPSVTVSLSACDRTLTA